MSIRFARKYFSRIALATLVGFFASSSARAQQTPTPGEPLAALAANLADTISHSMQDGVVVLHFSNSDRMVTALGQKLADELNDALSISAANFTVLKRVKIPAWKSTFLYQANSADGFREARYLNGKPAVFGTVSVEAGQLTLDVDAFRVDHQERLAGFIVKMPLTADLKTLEESPVEEKAPAAAASQGNKTDALAKCIYCPPSPVQQQSGPGDIPRGNRSFRCG